MLDGNTYDVGDLIELSASFTDLAGDPAAPEMVVCTVRKPDGTEVTPMVSGTANPYTAKGTADQSGPWWYAFDGGPDVQASGERSFWVRRQQVPR